MALGGGVPIDSHDEIKLGDFFASVFGAQKKRD